MIENILKELEKETNFIYDNYDSFTDEFIKCDFIDMYEIRYNYNEISFVYISDSGCHIVEHIDIKKYLKWKNKTCKDDAKSN